MAQNWIRKPQDSEQAVVSIAAAVMTGLFVFMVSKRYLGRSKIGASFDALAVGTKIYDLVQQSRVGTTAA